MLTYTIIISIILYIVGWLFTVCKIDNISVKEMFETDGIEDCFVLLLRFVFWTPVFFYMFVVHQFQFFTKKW